MNTVLIDIRKKLRYFLALLLFLGILIGGSAAALAVLAAGISAISSPSRTISVSSSTTRTVQSTAPKVSGQATNSSVITKPTTTSIVSSGAGHVDFSQRLNNQIDHMHSPIGDAIDNGGVALGNQVQTIFGNVLSGVLKSLFLEQPDHASTTTVTSQGGN